MFSFLKKRRRERLKTTPTPSFWRDLLQDEVPYFNKLLPEDQEELINHMKVFLAEKEFSGALGFVVTDHVKLIIAAYACILLLHRKTDYYPLLDLIVIYPEAYIATVKRDHNGVCVVTREARLGESWPWGTLVLSWSAIRADICHTGSSRNLIFHEFAHQLDQESGQSDGAPVLDKSSQYQGWANILSFEYKKLIYDIERDHKHFFDDYAATSPAEFFAVITEYFFDRPLKFKKKHPQLYQQLTTFYQQDPARRYDQI
ncbi:MAG: zinc-dependent peptidase [Deltaproteobacteria bacterium]|nr:zinc-dependent peptidase [Deltaproteobacteria bacterium]